MKKKILLISALALLIIQGCSNPLYVSSEFKCTSIETVDVVQTINNKYTQVYKEVNPSVGVVYVLSNNEYKILSGTIFKKDGNNYYMVTSIIDPTKALEYEIFLGDRQFIGNDEITYVGSHAPFGMSILKITTDKEIKVPTIGVSSDLSVGEDILAIGTPNASNLFNTLTKGVVSGLVDTYYPQYNPPYQADASVNIVGFQIDAPTNYGQKGGGVFNLDGELIGIIAERYYISQSGTTTITIDSMSFIMGMDELANPFNSIIEKGSYTKPRIGVTVLDLFAMGVAQKQTLNSDTQDPLPTPIPLDIFTGLYIKTIAPSSAAEAANLPVGQIITHVDNIPIRKMSTLDSRLMHYNPGDTITLTILNPTNMQSNTYTVTLK